MGGVTWQLVLVAALIVVNALFSGSEMALVTLREGQVRRLASASRSGRALARLARDPNRFLATIQIGITTAGFLASAAAAVSLAEPLVGPLAFLGAAAEPVAVVLVTVVLTFVTLVAGELAPKRVAMQRAEQWALLAARPLDALATATRPLVRLLAASSDLLVRAVGGDPSAARDEVTVDEIRDMITARRDVSVQQQEIISGAFEIAERTLREIIVPRRAIVTLDEHLPAADGLERLLAAGHSRAPVVGAAGLDSTAGVAHLRDLVRAHGRVADHVRPAVFLPETVLVSDALRRLRAGRQQFALVVDEYGTVAGMVTMEDLVEEIVGEIYDETDRDVLAVVREDGGALVVPGTFPLHDLPDVGVVADLPDDGEVTTVGGLVMLRLQRVPEQPGERVEVGSHTAEVLAIAGRAVTSVRLVPRHG